MDDNSCAPNANLSDSVIAPDAWGMAFAGQYYLPFEGSPVINHLPGECVALGLSQSTPPTPGQLQTDQRRFKRSDGACDAGAIEYHPLSFLPLVFK